MSIQSLLKDKHIYFPLRYYGPIDFATGWDVKALVDNQVFFRDLISGIQLKDLQNKEDFVKYLLCLKVNKIKEVGSSIVLDENKKIINKLSEIAEKAIRGISAGNIVKLINMNYPDLLQSDIENYDIREVTIDYICIYKSGISFDVFDYISKSYGYLYIDRFEEFAEILEKHPDLFERIFKEHGFDELRLGRMLDVWKSILRKKESELKPIVAKYNEVLFNSIVSAVDDSEKNIYILNNQINLYYDFLRTQRDVKANQMYEIKKVLNEKTNNEVLKNGKVFKTEIPVGEIINHWKSYEMNELKLLLLTHNRRDQEKLLSSLSFETAEKGLLDLVSSNIPTDDFFSSSHLMALSSIEVVSKATLMALLHDEETRKELYGLLSSSIITAFYAAHVNEEDIINEINTLLVSMNLVQQYKNSETVNYCVFYGFCMYTCALIEKLLRAVYYDQASLKEYIKLDGTTLKALLNENNTYMNVIFDVNHIRNLNYFLVKDNQGRIGKNIRNSLAHLSEISIEDVTYDLCLTVFWLLIDIVNSIILFYLDRNGGRIEFVVLPTQ